MDVISHGLWGGIALGRKKKRDFFLAFSISFLPDLLSEGILFILIALNLKDMPSFSNGHPDITEFPLYAQNLYNATHSLIVFATIFSLIWLVNRRPLWILLAWALHILIDIPTHDITLFPTSFLWPLSKYRFDGIGWHKPIIMILDVSLLFILYLYWFIRYRSKQK